MSDAFTTLEAEAAEKSRLLSLLPKAKAVATNREEPLVRVQNLRVSFATGPSVLHGISFDLHHGECLALVGESGSGKSVTARTLVGLAGQGAAIRADTLSFGGSDLRGFSPPQWRTLRGKRVGFVMQDALGSLDPLQTVGSEVTETLRLHTDLDRRAREQRAAEILHSVGISDPELRLRQYPHQLSGGMRQRALIASAIACSPELLIADEPTTALDAAVQAQVLTLLKSLRTSRNAMLVVSHDLGVVSQLADTVAVMRQGVIVEYGPIEAVFRGPKHPYTQRLLDAVRSVHVRSRNVPPAKALAQAPVVLETKGLCKSFTGLDGKRRSAVKGVSFQLRKGETLGIVGESGSGKTTTLRMLLGLEQPDEGIVHIGGRDWSGLSSQERRAARRKLQVVFQDPLGSFDPRFSVADVVEEAIRETGDIEKSAVRQRAADLLKLTQLDPALLSRHPRQLSGGQRQRVSIARALAANPDILVCDEPVSALDVSVQKQILDLLQDLKSRMGLACVFISHDLGVIQSISDRILVMKDGVVVEEGASNEIFARPKHPYTKALLAAIPVPEFLGNAIHI